MNESEKQLEDFLEHRDGVKILSLRPQGDATTLNREAINLCEVRIGENKYTFGGISKKVYNKMVDKYHGKI